MTHHGEKNRTKHEEDEDELNNYTSEKLLSFPTKVNNNNNSKRSKTLLCNCWVCKILDSSTVTKTANDDVETLITTEQQYEPYSIVSETGDSIFYDPLLFNIFDNEKNKLAGAIYIAEDNIRDIVQQDELSKHLNGVNFRIEY